MSKFPLYIFAVHTQLILWAENVKLWFKSLVFPFTFQAYILLHTLNCMCVSLFKVNIWILEQFKCCQKWPALPRHLKLWVLFELFGALYMYISDYGFNNRRCAGKPGRFILWILTKKQMEVLYCHELFIFRKIVRFMPISWVCEYSIVEGFVCTLLVYLFT